MSRIPLILAMQTLKKNGLRSILTVFGITIGVAMVVLVLSAGIGVKTLVLGEVSQFGDDWIDIEIKIPSAGKTSIENATSVTKGVSITTLTQGDMRAVVGLDNVRNAYAGITTQAVVSYGAQKERPSVFGVSASYNDIDKTEIVDGRFFTSEEDQAAAQVVVLGHEIRSTLFGNQEAIGTTVKIDGRGFRVIGVFEEIGAAAFINLDELVYIPVTTVQKKMMGIDHVLWIIGQVKDNSKAESTAEEIRSLIRQRHSITDPDKDDFSVTTQGEALAIVDTVFVAITWLLVGLATVSLLVGGVGIMNVMYVSVAERTFEIGLRKAVGATRRDILLQFLTEATFITFVGAVMGVLLGIALSFTMSVLARTFGVELQFAVSVTGIVISILFSTAVGLFFGLQPARNAASLDPIEALRKE